MGNAFCLVCLRIIRNLEIFLNKENSPLKQCVCLYLGGRIFSYDRRGNGTRFISNLTDSSSSLWRACWCGGLSSTIWLRELLWWWLHAMTMITWWRRRNKYYKVLLDNVWVRALCKNIYICTYIIYVLYIIHIHTFTHTPASVRWLFGTE